MLDLGREVEFYELFGLQRVGGDAGHAILAADGAPLVRLTSLPNGKERPRHTAGLYHFAILLPNEQELGSFLQRSLEVRLPLTGTADHFVSQALYFDDPEGNGIEVYADRPRSAWRHEARQLTMTTIPLDVEDLIAAGGGEPWTGAPASTTIGHIHLYVRDIDQAAAFYHDALGFDKVVWNYPGALFMSAGGYHHHLGTNTWAAQSPTAADDDAKLIEWEVVVPSTSDVADAAASLESAGYSVERSGETAAARDPWGTQLRLVSEG